MTIEEMITKKSDLQNDIHKLLIDFEDKTSLEITGLDMLRGFMYGPGENKGIITDVFVEVKLP